jgi:hypothetical protein
MVAHDAFEALAGAIALGEATPVERATFAAHAETCAMCRTAIADVEMVREVLVASRDDERWLPSVDARVRSRIGDERHRRARATFGAFHWAIAFSLVLNVAFFSGFVGRLATKLHATGEPASSVVATVWVTEHKRTHPSVGAAIAIVATHVMVSSARTVDAHRARALSRRAPRVAAVTNRVATDAALASLDVPAAATDAIPDMLAGLDVDAHAARRVASTNAARCKTAPYDECPGEVTVDAP